MGYGKNDSKIIVEHSDINPKRAKRSNLESFLLNQRLMRATVSIGAVAGLTALTNLLFPITMDGKPAPWYIGALLPDPVTYGLAGYAVYNAGKAIKNSFNYLRYKSKESK